MLIFNWEWQEYKQKDELVHKPDEHGQIVYWHPAVNEEGSFMDVCSIKVMFWELESELQPITPETQEMI